MANYKRGDTIVAFTQEIIGSNMGNIDTEFSDPVSVSVFEENDGIFIEHQTGDISLWWIYDGYLLSIGGNLTKNEAINLALSTKIVETPRIF